MNYEELLDLIKIREGYTLELKESMSSNIGKDICAFANSNGGKIIVGVTDDGKIKSYKLNNKDRSKIQDIARNMNPSFYVNFEEVEDLVILYIPIGKDKSYTVNGHFYVRQGANSQQLNRDEIREFFHSVLRNPIIADCILRTGLFDKLDSEVNRIKELYPKTKFEIDTDWFRVIFEKENPSESGKN